MIKPRLSVCLDDFSADIKTAMAQARALAFNVVDVGAVQGPIAPGELSQTGRRHLLKHLADLGLRLGSLRGPTGGPGYADGRHGEQRLETMRRILLLARDLQVPVASTILGRSSGLSVEEEIPRWRETLLNLADDADRTGVIVALETAGLEASLLQGLLTQINCPMLTACCDSGAMLMRGENPHDVGELLPGRVHLVRGRDAQVGTVEAPGHEAAPGDGQLDVPRFLAALNQAGFAGDIVLSRSDGPDREGDLLRARALWSKVLQE